jgi:flagellar hook-basal body complex protein FliE
MTAPLSLGSALPTSLGPLTQGSTLPSSAPLEQGSALGGLGRATEGVRAPSAPDFEHLVRDAVGEVSAMQDRAEVAAHGYVSGDHQDVHGTMIVMQEADISLRLAANVRNRVIEAYREVMRMGA